MFRVRIYCSHRTETNGIQMIIGPFACWSDASKTGEQLFETLNHGAQWLGHLTKATGWTIQQKVGDIGWCECNTEPEQLNFEEDDESCSTQTTANS